MDPQNEESQPSASKDSPDVKLTQRNTPSPLIKQEISKDDRVPVFKPVKKTFGKGCMKYLYNKEEKTFCERTCQSWFYMIAYALMYLTFLCTYTLIFLYGTLIAMKYTVDYQTIDKAELLTYSTNGVGLTVEPISGTNSPIIWYRNDDNDFKRYVDAIDRFLHNSRRKRGIQELGPCGEPPYGYGETPCLYVRINKQWKWAGQPLQLNSTKAENAPKQVQEWMKNDRKLWLLCSGYHSYDQEHIGTVKYFPDPPGFDPNLFPLDVNSVSPFIAIQISNFSLGISLAIDCKLWYETGPSSVEFMLYVQITK